MSKKRPGVEAAKRLANLEGADDTWSRVESQMEFVATTIDKYNLETLNDFCVQLGLTIQTRVAMTLWVAARVCAFGAGQEKDHTLSIWNDHSNNGSKKKLPPDDDDSKVNKTSKLAVPTVSKPKNWQR
jgi:hypothetical protein